jgi:GT2 family glycosyltransferase
LTISVIEERVKEPTAFITLVVLNFNGKIRLKRCLDSLLTTNYPNFQVVVVDNGSTDMSVEFVNTNYPNIKVIKHNHNYGFAQGYNLAMDVIDSEYIAFVNNDIIVEPNWLRALIAPLRNNKNAAAATPKMLFLDNPTLINAAGGSCDVYCVGLNRGNGEVDRGQYDSLEEVFYGNGGALLVKNRVWREIGPFDERYFMYGEDVDWCWRARLRGYKIIYVPNSRVYHQWRGSRESQMIYVLERHWLSTILKNYSLKTLVFLIPKFAGLKFLKAVWLIRNGRSNEKLAVVKAIFWNIINLRTTWQKRVQIQTFRTLHEAAIKRHMFKQSFELLLWLGILKHPILKRK